MSFPNIPDVKPTIALDRDQTINLLLASIAFEELGLAHIINSEAEKIQFAVGTLDSCKHNHRPTTIEELLAVNTSVEHTLRNVIKKEMLLQFKLEDTIALANQQHKLRCFED